MEAYLSNFIQHSGQIDSFLGSAAVWAGFFVIGYFFLGKDKLLETAPFYGWAAVNFVLTIFGVFTSVSFLIISALFGISTIAACIFLIWKKERLFPPGLWKIALLASPLLLLVSAMIGSQWDEFSDWLISPRLMLETNAFPTSEDSHRSGTLAAYPFGWHYVSYLASLLAGRFLENAGALVNVLMLLTFSLVSIRLIRTGLNQDPHNLNPGWVLCAIGGLSTTLLNTTFVQKVVLTSYADVATSTLTGLGVVIGWYMLEALAEGRHKEAMHNAFQIGLLMMLLINLKQSTVVMFVIVVAAILLAGLRDSRIDNRQLPAALLRMIVPAIVIFVSWRYYVGQELDAKEMSVAPFDDWLIEYIPQILTQMLIVLSKKGAFFLLLVLVIGFGLRALFSYRTPFDRFALIAGVVFLGHNAFLLFAYMTSFGKYDALRVASYWRYNMQLGMIGVAFTAFGLSILWRKYANGALWPKKIAWIPIVLMVIAPFIFAEKLRFDRHPPVPHFRKVAMDLTRLLNKEDALVVLDPRGTGESGVIARYELGGQEIFRSFQSAFHNLDREEFIAYLKGGNFTHALVHSTKPVQQAVLGPVMDESHSYLLEKVGDGRWQIVKTWAKPD